jgi:hypothetical protein
VPIGVFFVFGATMAAYAAFTLLVPDTPLDFLWVLNPDAYARLDSSYAPPFLLLSTSLALAALGWFRRRLWGWVLGIVLIALQVLGDLVSIAIGEPWKGGVGAGIAGLLLLYLAQPRVRRYFIQSHYFGDLWQLCFSRSAFAQRKAMSQSSGVNREQSPCFKCGVVVTIVALSLAGWSFGCRLYLRSTVPQIDATLPKYSNSSATNTTAFLKQQAKEAYETALSLGGQLEASHQGKSSKQLANYRQAVTILHALHTKREESLEADAIQRQDQQLWKYMLMRERIENHDAAASRAARLNVLMILVVTMIAVVILFFALRSPCVPNWAKGIAMMASGAILAGWFPL